MRAARIRCGGCGERVGFMELGDDGAADIQLRRVGKTPWNKIAGGQDPAGFQERWGDTAAAAQGRGAIFLVTGCPRCFSVLSVEQSDLQAAADAFHASGRVQNITANPEVPVTGTG